MKPLKNVTQQKILLNNVIIADNFVDRAIGLMGKKNLDRDACMWIKDCNWVHNWFVKFPIDVVFVDKNLNVKFITKNLKPWGRSRKVFRAQSVFEMNSGMAEKLNIKIGDQLYVGA